MTRIYFADKVDDYLGTGKKKAAKGIMKLDRIFKKRSTSSQEGKIEKTSDPQIKGEKKKVNADQSWGSSMRGLFNLIAWVSQHGVYRIFNHQPFELLNGWGHLFGMAFLGKVKGVRRKISASIQALYPHWDRKQVKKYTDASIKYMGAMFLDFMFRLPRTCDFPDEKFKDSPFFEYEGLERLDAAIAKGKGVIVTMLHMGEFFHSMAALFQHPKHYYCGGVAAVSNLVLYRMNNRKHFDQLHIFASTDFEKISGVLERFLKHNGILAMAHDYASPKQLRVPMIYGKFPYLVNVPQSYISLQRKTGAEILPCIAYPNDVLGKSRIVFLDNKSIMDVIQRNADASKREFHGRVSTELNRINYPIIRQYAHNWEEIMNLATVRLADKVQFPANITMEGFCQGIFDKMRAVLENTFEPERDDKVILTGIQKYADAVMGSLKQKNAALRPHKTKINLSLMDSISELQKLTGVAIKELNQKGELEACQSLRQLNLFLEQHANVKQCYHEILLEEKIDLSLTARLWEKVHGVVDKFWEYEEDLKEKLIAYEEIMANKMRALKNELKQKVLIAVETVKKEYSQVIN
jgi:lauroyl/myristoyl acyltransferase